MIKAIVAGAAGRMGGRIIHMIRQSKDVELSGAFELAGHASVGQDVGQVVGLGEMGIKIGASLEEVMDAGDVLIDFTSPQATLENIRLAVSRSLPMVIGTTGIIGEMLEEMLNLARANSRFLPNMQERLLREVVAARQWYETSKHWYEIRGIKNLPLDKVLRIWSGGDMLDTEKVVKALKDAWLGVAEKELNQLNLKYLTRKGQINMSLPFNFLFSTSAHLNIITIPNLIVRSSSVYGYLTFL